MPLASLSPESQTNSILDSVGCAVSNFSAIVGTLSNSRVTAALSGQNDFSKEDGEQHLRVAREMQRLVKDSGLPIDWRQVNKIREVLASRLQNASETRPVPHYVLYLSNGQVFEGVQNGEVLKTDDQRRVSGMDNSTVYAVQKLLKQMGHDSRVVRVTNFHRDLGTSVQEFGFQPELVAPVEVEAQ